MMVDIPDDDKPTVFSDPKLMGEVFVNCTVGCIELRLFVREILEKHNADLEDYLTVFLFAVKVEMNRQMRAR
jgi:hypothetical protein